MQASRAAVPVLLAVLLTGCSAGVEEPDTAGAAARDSSASPESSVAASTSASAPAAPATSPTPQTRRIEVSYAGGQVTGTSGREQVRLGEQVVLVVRSDVAEEVHVHGYDAQAAVPAGGAAQLPLSATIPGVFEVELHDAGKVLYQLRVS